MNTSDITHLVANEDELVEEDDQLVDGLKIIVY